MNGLIQHLATSGLDLSEDNILRISVSNVIWWYYNDIIRWDLPSEFYLVIYVGIWNPTLTRTGDNAYRIQYYHISNETTKNLIKETNHIDQGLEVFVEEKSPTSGYNFQYFLDDSTAMSACGIYLKSI